MKLKKFPSVIYILIMSIAFCEAKDTSAADKNDDRLYIDSGIVYVDKQGIFLSLNDNILPITAISQDENGVFVTVESAAVYMISCRRYGKEYDVDNQSSKCPHGWILIR